MRNTSKLFCLLIIACFSIVTNTIAQKSGEQKKKSQPQTPKPIIQDNNINLEGAIKITPKLNEFEANDPAKVHETKIKAGKEKAEDIIKYFINESENIKYFTFQDDVTKRAINYKVDSLLFMFKEKLDSFLSKLPSPDLGFGKYLANSEIKAIQEKIESEYNRPTNKRDNNALREIKDLISQLSPSKEKVDLQLRYAAMLTLKNEGFSEKLSAVYLEIDNTITQIKDPYEKSKGYLFVGNFAHNFKDEQYAMQMYYLGRLWLQKSSISSQLKSQEEGLFCQNISNLFLERSNASALEKAIEYYNEANFYFRETANADYIKTNWSYKFANTAYLLSQFYYLDTSMYTAQRLTETLNSINFWYYYFKKGRYNPEINYNGLYSIAVILKREGKPHSSLLFYLWALSYAFDTKNASTIGQALSNVAYAYRLLEDKKMYFEYQILRIELANKTDKYLDFNLRMLEAADDFYDEQKYDSALSILNSIQFDTVLVNHLYPPFYEDLVIGVLSRKYYMLEALKSDSARKYETDYFQAKEDFEKRYASLLEEEGYGRQNWLNTVRTNDIEKLALKLDTLKSQKEDLSKTNLTLLRDAAKLKSLNKTYSDSLISKNKMLLTLTIKARYYDSLAKSRKAEGERLQSNISSKESELRKANAWASQMERQKRVAVKTRNIAWASTGAAILVFGGGLFFSYRRIKKNKTEAKRLAIENEQNNYQLKFEKSEAEREIVKERGLKESKEIELKQLDNLAKNKIHNFQNDFHVLPNMLQSGNIESAIRYTNEYGSYQTLFFENWKKEIISLEDEISLLNQYSKVKEASGKLVAIKVTVDDEIDKSKTRFIQSVFDTLLDNSIRRGFKDKTGVCEFCVSISKEGDYLYCEVTDNGTPPNDPNSYFRRDSSGLNILKSRIKAMYEIRNRKVPTDFFTADKLPQDSGTTIKVRMPNEEIV